LLLPKRLRPALRQPPTTLGEIVVIMVDVRDPRMPERMQQRIAAAIIARTTTFRCV
jgi:hypothetical protein